MSVRANVQLFAHFINEVATFVECALDTVGSIKYDENIENAADGKDSVTLLRYRSSK